MIDGAAYLAAKRSQPKTAQATPWQEEGARAAERMGEPGKSAAYIRIFKRNWFVRDKLEECLAWVESKPDVDHRGKLFMAMHKRFIQPFKNQ